VIAACPHRSEGDANGRDALANFVPALVDRCRALTPNRIVLIKTAVFDAAGRLEERRSCL
jgi:hypothetical protein